MVIRGKRLAEEAEALQEWLRLQRAQLAKVRKREELRARLRHVTARLALLQAALAEWDDDCPPEVCRLLSLTCHALNCRSRHENLTESFCHEKDWLPRAPYAWRPIRAVLHRYHKSLHCCLLS